MGAVWGLQTREAARLRQQAAVTRPDSPPLEDHVALVQNTDSSRLVTNDSEELHRWFAGQLRFAPPVPEWPWARLVAGRVCTIKGSDVAWIDYETEAKTFTLFIQRTDEGGHASGGSSGATAALAEHRGYRTASWCADGFSFVLVARQSAEPVFQYLAAAD